MITNIDQIKAAADVVDIIGRYVQLKHKGKQHEGLCPFHNEKSPSFKIHQGRYKCFGCGKSGDVFDFIMEHDNLSYIDAVTKVAELSNIPLEHSQVKPDPPVPRLETLSPETIKYFESRGISNNTLIRHKITEAIEWMPKAGTEVRTICFNYFRDEQLINIKFRAKDKDFKLNKGSELIFYNLDAIKDETECYITEGEIDCLSLYECGIYNAVSVPNGAEATKIEYLTNCWQYFAGMERVIIMTDNDEPGGKLKEELARRIGMDKCYYIDYPQGCKDANDILRQHGKAALKALTEEPRRWPIEGVITLDDIYTNIIDYYNNGYPEGLAAGIGEFDNLLTFSGGQFTTVTGSPQSGKSEFIDYITSSMSRQHGWRWAVCSFENPPAFHATKIMEKFIGLSFAHRKDPSHRMDADQRDQAMGFIDHYYKFINIAQVNVSIQGILSKCRELILRYGVKGIVIDPWNYIEHKVPPNQTETQYISECLSLIKEFVVKNDVHLFLVAHPTKLKKGNDGKYPIATMYDIAGSAHFFNKTDNGISVHRDFINHVVDVYVQKVRFSWQGNTGFTSFTFDTFTRQYKSL